MTASNDKILILYMKGDEMKKISILIVSICFVLMFSNHLFACIENCGKKCSNDASNATSAIRDSCEDTADFYNQMAVFGGEIGIYGDEWIGKCVVDSKQAYYQECVDGCDKCKDDKDFLGGCFVDNLIKSSFFLSPRFLP